MTAVTVIFVHRSIRTRYPLYTVTSSSNLHTILVDTFCRFHMFSRLISFGVIFLFFRGCGIRLAGDTSSGEVIAPIAKRTVHLVMAATVVKRRRRHHCSNGVRWRKQ